MAVELVPLLDQITLIDSPNARRVGRLRELQQPVVLVVHGVPGHQNRGFAGQLQRLALLIRCRTSRKLVVRMCRSPAGDDSM